MATTQVHLPHEPHPHVHEQKCGHAAIPHGDHTDYLHDGHVHRPHGDHTDEALLESADVHSEHVEHTHVHRSGCGHTVVKHGVHEDYLHDGHRHAVHGDHVDEH